MYWIQIFVRASSAGAIFTKRATPLGGRETDGGAKGMAKSAAAFETAASGDGGEFGIVGKEELDGDFQLNTQHPILGRAAQLEKEEATQVRRSDTDETGEIGDARRLVQVGAQPLGGGEHAVGRVLGAGARRGRGRSAGGLGKEQEGELHQGATGVKLEERVFLPAKGLKVASEADEAGGGGGRQPAGRRAGRVLGRPRDGVGNGREVKHGHGRAATGLPKPAVDRIGPEEPKGGTDRLGRRELGAKRREASTQNGVKFPALAFGGEVRMIAEIARAEAHIRNHGGNAAIRKRCIGGPGSKGSTTSPGG